MRTHECTDIHTIDKIDRLILTPSTEQPLLGIELKEITSAC